MFPWQEARSVKPYLIVNTHTGEVMRDDCTTEDEVFKAAMVISFRDNIPIEVYQATGFGNWKNELRATRKMKEHAAKED